MTEFLRLKAIYEHAVAEEKRVREEIIFNNRAIAHATTAAELAQARGNKMRAELLRPIAEGRTMTAWENMRKAHREL